ncbi:MAG: hypothetical protein ACRD1J_07615 [Terriglobia bacterium]
MNPQSLNRYAYALNNPTTLTDPLGLDGCQAGATCVTVTAPPPSDLPLINGSVPSFLSLQSFINQWICKNNSGFCGANGAKLGFSFSNWVANLFPAHPTPILTFSPNKGNQIKCSGSARVLQGNAATIGKAGGFSGPSVGNIPVTANGADVIPSQWGGKAALRPFLNQISGAG